MTSSIVSLAPTVIASTVQNYHSPVSSDARNTEFALTNSFEEESVKEEIVLNEQEWPLALLARPLNQDVKGTLGSKRRISDGHQTSPRYAHLHQHQ